MNLEEFDPALHDWSNEADAPVPEGHPLPLLWRALVVPRRPATVSKGGIALPSLAMDAQRHLEFVGQIVALGELAFKSDVFKDMAEIPKVGDWVVYGRYAGQPLLFKGCRFLIIDDKQILCRVPNPADLAVNL